MFPSFDSLPTQVDLDDAAQNGNVGMPHRETAAKLDRLEEVLRRCLASEGTVSIPAIGRELGLSRQAVTYQLQVLGRERGVKIPANRRCVQVQPFLMRSCNES